MSPALVSLARSHDVAVVALDAASIEGALHVEEHDGLLAKWLAAAGCRGALVRPDHYVFGGFASDDEARHLLDQFASALHLVSQHSKAAPQAAVA